MCYSHAPAIYIAGGATLQRRCYRLAGRGDGLPRRVLVTYAHSVSRRRPCLVTAVGHDSGRTHLAEDLAGLQARLDCLERELFREREKSAELGAQLALAWAATGTRALLREAGVTTHGATGVDAVLVERATATGERHRLEFLLATEANSCSESCLSGVEVMQGTGPAASIHDWALEGGARPATVGPVACAGEAPVTWPT